MGDMDSRQSASFFTSSRVAVQVTTGIEALPRGQKLAGTALGQNATAPRLHTSAHQQLGSAGAGAAAGLYLGFIGPASQSFLLLGFVHLFGFDFRRASECAQIVVNGLNLASLLWFIAFSHVVFPIGLAMGACSVAGAVLGSRLIRKGGNRLIRRLFLGLLVIEIGRFTFGLF